MICIFISPLFIIQYLKNIGVNNGIIGVLILLFVIIVLNSTYGDFISSKIEFKLQLIKDNMQSAVQQIKISSGL